MVRATPAWGQGVLSMLPKAGVGAGGWPGLFQFQRTVFVGLAKPDSLWLYFKPTESNYFSLEDFLSIIIVSLETI